MRRGIVLLIALSLLLTSTVFTVGCSTTHTGANFTVDANGD